MEADHGRHLGALRDGLWAASSAHMSEGVELCLRTRAFVSLFVPSRVKIFG